LDYLDKLGRGWVGELDGRIVGFSYADRQDNSRNDVEVEFTLTRPG
jgi:hypothetical protein